MFKYNRAILCILEEIKIYCPLIIDQGEFLMSAVDMVSYC